MAKKKGLFRWRNIVIGAAVLLIAGGALALKNRKGIDLALVPIDFNNAETPGAFDCLWIGPVNYRSFNVAFPDEGAIYWPTVFKLPEGSYLEITGTFPKGRYLSFHSYDEGYRAYHKLNDQEIVPDAGTQNPFTTVGVTDPGTYTIKVVAEDVPETPVANTLYLGTKDIGTVSPLVLRIYIPETEGDLTGGAGLPQATLVKASGERLTGQAMCDAIGSPKPGSPKRTIRSPIVEKASYLETLAKNDLTTGFPAKPEADWMMFWDPRIEVMRIMSPWLVSLSKTLAQWGFWDKTTGFYAALDNQYVATYLNDMFGKVVVLEGRLPRTPQSGWDAPSGSYDLRYWSICSNEGLATTRFADCLYDREVQTDQDRYYRIVVSKKADRPANATAECGVSWLDWGDAGDGAGNENIGILVMRNMLPSAGFAQAIQNIPALGKERQSMGEYLPKTTYTSRAAFEAEGCAKG